MRIFQPRQLVKVELKREGNCYVIEWECPVCHGEKCKIEAVEWLADYTLPEQPRIANCHCGRVDYQVKLIGELPPDFWKTGESIYGRKLIQ